MKPIDQRLATLPAAERAALEHIRQLVHTLVPESEEVISYGMPGFKYRGQYLLGFAAFKGHLSLFPTSAPVAAFADKLQGFQLARGTIQFTPDHQIPEPLLKAIIQKRKTDIENSA